LVEGAEEDLVGEEAVVVGGVDSEEADALFIPSYPPSRFFCDTNTIFYFVLHFLIHNPTIAQSCSGKASVANLEQSKGTFSVQGKLQTVSNKNK